MIAGGMLLPAQCRMARAAFGWSLDTLAEVSGVNRKTILRFERGEASTRSASIEAIRRAFEEGGARFIEVGADAGGVVAPVRLLGEKSD